MRCYYSYLQFAGKKIGSGKENRLFYLLFPGQINVGSRQKSVFSTLHIKLGLIYGLLEPWEVP